MDLDAIYDVPVFHQLTTLPELEALRENNDPKKILIYAFLGGHRAGQSDPLDVAISQARRRYHLLGYTIEYETFSNDKVRNKLKWSVTQLFTKLMSADIHLLPTHCHQGNISLGGTDTWNIPNILENYDRLRFHLGIPNGRHLTCPVFTQDKRKLYEKLMELGLCLPTTFVSIAGGVISTDSIAHIERYVDLIIESKYIYH